MHKVIDISLSGHPAAFRLHADAYAALTGYLERAEQRLAADPDRAEVLRDVEQAIGDKLAARLTGPAQVAALADVNAVLAQMGPVESDSAEASAPPVLPHGRRRLVRIQEGQSIWGVCQGLAVYSHIGVDWVRTIFVMLTLVTGGAFILVYVGLALLLPVVPTRAAYLAEAATPAP
jgi:phage shock protein PspC (stress-responsive transcriptional regulator)